MTTFDRRRFLALGCCAAAAPMVTPVAFAQAPGDRRFVAIILRGAMDGLDAVQPYMDPNMRLLRPSLALTPDQGLIDLDGRFGMHPGLAGLTDLWRRRELAFVHAVSTPYRDGRSHFDGQDILETGGGLGDGPRDGWLNRALGSMPRRTGQHFALNVGRQSNLVLQGSNPYDSWSPEMDLDLQDNYNRLLDRLYSKDPLFSEALRTAMGVDAEVDEIEGLERRYNSDNVAGLAANLLKDEARVAVFSLTGWDTHVNQARGLNKRLKQLSSAILTLQAELGPNIWRETVVLAMTEFGRTARENGSNGTDHGTGGAAILAGGAIRGGRIYGRWPGIGQGQLYENRDLTPTQDVRRYAAWALRGLYGVQGSALESSVFPGLDMGSDPGFLA